MFQIINDVRIDQFLDPSAVEFAKLVRAEKSGEQPSLTFTIKKMEEVTKFLQTNHSLWSETLQSPDRAPNARFGYTLNGNRLTIFRNVGHFSFPKATNEILAGVVLRLIPNMHFEARLNIWIGLTGKSLSEFTPA